MEFEENAKKLKLKMIFLISSPVRDNLSITHNVLWEILNILTETRFPSDVPEGGCRHGRHLPVTRESCPR